ncbi:MAG: hypothetical protein CL878_15965 [Dehalococcoidia bacterium]|nr:hypothetical protein [Dehalococcoidia bacterium]
MVNYMRLLRSLLPMIALALALAPGLALAAGLAPGAWPMHQRDGRHTGQASSSGPTDPQLAWYFLTDAPFTAGAVIDAQGTLYISADDGIVRALHPQGHELWKRELKTAVHATPLLTDRGELLVAARNGVLYALATTDGVTKWSFATGSDLLASPAVASDGQIALPAESGELIILRPDGTEHQRHRSGGAIRSAPAVGADDVVYWGADNSIAYAGSLGGSLVWTSLLDAPITAGPVVAADGTVYFFTSKLWALDGANGGVRWQTDLGSRVLSTPALATDGTIYLTTEDGRVAAYTSAGSLRWTYQTGGSLRTSPIVGANALVYVSAGDSLVYVLGAAGNVVGTFKTLDGVWASPALGADGRLYVGGRDKRFYALREGGRDLGQSPPDRLGGDLLRDPATGKVYVLIDGARRHIPDPGTQLLLRLTSVSKAATPLELVRYPEGLPLPTLKTGSLVRSAHGPVYALQGSQRVWIASLAALIAGGYQWDQVQTVADRVMGSLPLEIEAGYLVKASGAEVYLIEGGKRRWITTGAVFAARGYRWDQVHFVSDADLGAIPLGDPIS